METEELEEVERHHGKAANGLRKDSSPQAISCLGLVCEYDSEASDHVTEKEPQTCYIPIRRNSRYYRSIRRRDRGKGQSSNESQTEHVEGKFAVSVIITLPSLPTESKS